MNNNSNLKVKLAPSLLVFQEVVRWQSYTKAGTVLGMSKSAVSQHVKKLEEALNIPLLNRNTRNLAVTEAGKAIYEKGHLLGEIISQSLSSSKLAPHLITGKLSVTIPHILETSILVPVLSQMHIEFPKLTFQVDVSDQYHDLIQNNFDVALTGGYRESSSYKLQKIATIDTHCYAHPERANQWQRSSFQSTQKIPWVYANWQKNTFSGSLSETSKSVALKKVLETTSIMSAINFATSGSGVVIAADIAVEAQVQKGTLVRVFENTFSKTEPIFFMHAFRNELPLHVKRFKELVIEQFLLIKKTIQ